MANLPSDQWAADSSYELYMGRWSRALARNFLEALRPRPGAAWLEVGCGTGALTTAIRERAEPASVVACDPSEPFVACAKRALAAAPVSFAVAMPRRRALLNGVSVAQGLLRHARSEALLRWSRTAT
jgi:ubiquinone/menaquinone biosynthesis C-methylase UbiE